MNFFRRKTKLIGFLIIISIMLTIINATVLAYDAFTSETTSSNNTYSTAQLLTSEVIMKGSLPSGDSCDWYKISVSSGYNLYAHLSSVPTGCDWDLELYNTNGTTLLKGSANFQDLGECINHTVSTSGTYYIKVVKSSGDSSSKYKLYVQSKGKAFNHSFYVENPRSSSYMTSLGRDHCYNVSGPVILSFGQPDKSGSDYGVWGFDGTHLTFSQIKTAVESFIAGYNSNQYHKNYIQIIVGVSNYRGTSLVGTSEYTNWGAAFKNGVNSISKGSSSSYVDAIYGGLDAEMSWNSNTYTKAIVDGYSNTGTYNKLYNYGNHLGDTIDFSSQTDPVWNFTKNGVSWSWYASDVYYVSYKGCCYCMPEIYNNNDDNRWAYQKKWGSLHSMPIYFAGLLSTNGWSDESVTTAWLYNQQSYDNFNNMLTSVGQGETLENGTWIARRSQY